MQVRDRAAGAACSPSSARAWRGGCRRCARRSSSSTASSPCSSRVPSSPPHRPTACATSARRASPRKMQIQQQEENELDQRARLRTLERQRGERQRELAALQAEYDDLPFKAQSQIAGAEAQHRRARAGPGQFGGAAADPDHRADLRHADCDAGSCRAAMRRPTTPLLSILPAGSKLEAQLFTPSRSIGFVRVGQQVLLRYQAFPYQKFGHHTRHRQGDLDDRDQPGRAAAAAVAADQPDRHRRAAVPDQRRARPADRSMPTANRSRCIRACSSNPTSCSSGASSTSGSSNRSTP